MDELWGWMDKHKGMGICFFCLGSASGEPRLDAESRTDALREVFPIIIATRGNAEKY
jgi:hypothetical protein